MTTPAQMNVAPAQPAGNSPVAHYLNAAYRPGTSTDGQYLVLPRAVLEKLPVQAQRQIAAALAVAHAAMPPDWTPQYQVTSLYWKPVDALTPADMSAAGVMAELAVDGEMVIRDLRTGQQLSTDQQVLAPVQDPLAAKRS